MLLGACVLMLLAACTSEESKTPLQQFLTEFNTRWCSKLAPCCANLNLVLSNGCGFHESRVQDVGGVFTEEMGRRCLDEVGTMNACSEVRFSDAPTCAAIFPKYKNPLTADLGEPCSESCNNPPARPSTCVPAARPVPRDAKGCQNRFGGHCDDKTHTCVPVIANGQPCTNSFHCASSSYCKRDTLGVPGTCQPQEPAGADCSRDDRTCDNFTWCEAGTCSPRWEPGRPCDRDARPDRCLSHCGSTAGERVCQPLDCLYESKLDFCVDARCQ